MDIGLNTEFEMKLTPNFDKVVCSQMLSLPINLKEDLIFEIALLHQYGIFTILPFSKFASSIFAQSKHNANPRLFVDLRKKIILIAGDYTNKNHPVSNFLDAPQNSAGKPLFCELNVSQVYH